jgi:outer membrane biosynthesis protein TonB
MNEMHVLLGWSLSSPRSQKQPSTMMTRLILALVASLVAVLLLALPVHARSSQRVAFVLPRQAPTSALLVARGGATAVDEDDEESEDEEEELAVVNEEEDDEEEEEEKKEEEEKAEAKLAAAKLASATVKKTRKAKSKKAATKKASVKKVLKAKLTKAKLTKEKPAVTKKEKKKGSLLKFLRLPYIVRACLNPFTVFAMTRAYWASLCNLNYGKSDDASQELRSALEAKAKRDGGTNRGKRKMKRGQAKSLSDLPALNT